LQKGPHLTRKENKTYIFEVKSSFFSAETELASVALLLTTFYS